MEEIEKDLEGDGEAAELERLLGRMGDGDTGALERFYELTHAGVYALALSITGRAEDAEELCHDAFLRVWDNAGRYRPQGTPRAWLMALTRNLCLMELRKRSRVVEISDEEWNALPAPAENVTAGDRLVLQTALGALDRVERQIVMLHAVSGLKHREIGKMLDMPLGTVLSKYKRSLEKMRQYMKGE